MTAPSFWRSIELPDVELTVCELIRTVLPDAPKPTAAVIVATEFPMRPGPGGIGNEHLADDTTYIVVRYDGGTTRTTDEQARVGITVSAPAGTAKQTGDLARYLRAALEAAPSGPPNPIASARCSGPVRVPGVRCERYLTASLTVCGDIFNRKGQP